jgi:hypothetical protein
MDVLTVAALRERFGPVVAVEGTSGAQRFSGDRQEGYADGDRDTGGDA